MLRVRFELEQRLKKSAIQTMSGNDEAPYKNIQGEIAG